MLETLRPLLEDPDFPKIGQNLKYEWQVFRSTCEIALDGVVCDTMLASYLLEPGRRVGLDVLAEDMLGHKMLSFKAVVEDAAGKTKLSKSESENGGGFSRVELKAATEYAAEDADVALRLAEQLMPKLEEERLDELAIQVEIPLAELLEGRT